MLWVPAPLKSVHNANFQRSVLHLSRICRYNLINLVQTMRGSAVSMQAIGFIGLFIGAVAAVTGFSAFLFSTLPEAVLVYAERHGRFQWLRARETLRNGTKAGHPPIGQVALAE